MQSPDPAVVRANEKDIIRRASAGDAEALGDLFTIHQGRVRRLLIGIVGPGADLDDLAQEVFLRVHQSISRFRGDAEFSTWLHRVVVNVAISHLRKRKRAAFNLGTSDVDKTSQAGPPGVHEEALGRELVRRLYRVLDTISVKRRTAFVLFELEGKSLLEVSRLLGIPVPAVKSRVWFARREIIKKAGEDPYLGQLLGEIGR